MALDLSLVGKEGSPVSFTYGSRDTILYALGIGAKKDELDWLYEGRGPKVLPSFAVVPMFKPMLDCVVETGGDLSMVVHGSQRVELQAELPPAATLTTVARVRNIYDMRKFAIVYIDTEVKDATGNLLATTGTQIIIRGAGNFGGDPPPKEAKVAEIPKGTEPDFRIEET